MNLIASEFLLVFDNALAIMSEEHFFYKHLLKCSFLKVAGVAPPQILAISLHLCVHQTLCES